MSRPQSSKGKASIKALTKHQAERLSTIGVPALKDVYTLTMGHICFSVADDYQGQLPGLLEGPLHEINWDSEHWDCLQHRLQHRPGLVSNYLPHLHNVIDSC